MKPNIYKLALVLSTAITGEVMAACPTTGQVTQGTSTFADFSVTFGGTLSNNKNATIGGKTLTKTGGSPINANTISSAFSTGNAPLNTSFSGNIGSNWTSTLLSGSTVKFTNSVPGVIPVIQASTNDNGLTVTPQKFNQGATTGGVTLSSLLLNHTICQGSGANKQAQEEHFSGGVLKDYKLGPSNPVDPEKALGSWTLANDGIGNTNATVTYNYTAFGPAVSFSYIMYLTSGTLGADGSTYNFCDTSTGTVTVSGAMLKTSLGAVCP